MFCLRITVFAKASVCSDNNMEIVDNCIKIASMITVFKITFKLYVHIGAHRQNTWDIMKAFNWKNIFLLNAMRYFCIHN